MNVYLHLSYTLQDIGTVVLRFTGMLFNVLYILWVFDMKKMMSDDIYCSICYVSHMTYRHC